jgi:hypothetical protein
MKTELSLFRFAGFRSAPAEIMRLVFVFSLVNALWSPLPPRGGAWVVLSVLLIGAGTLGIIFGRIVWEGKS